MLRKTIFICLVLFCIQSTLSQDIDKCKDIVTLTVESINQKSANKLKPHLASDFTIAGQTGEIAKMVLDQLVLQLNETIISHQEVSTNKTKQGLELKYNFEYKNMGVREAVFLFTKSNQLKDLKLFEMQVKTMSSNSTIERPSQNSIEIPFTKAGNLIAVKVVLDGEEKTFLLDSGAPRVILNTKYTQSNNANRTSISSARGVNGNISGMDIHHVNNLNFYGIQLNNQEVITVDLSHLEEDLGIAIHGLIGYDILKDYDVLFDYEAKKITLVEPEYFNDFKKEKLSDFKVKRVALELNQHIPIIKARIGGQDYFFGIDSGAETNLIDDDLYQKLQPFLINESQDVLMGIENENTTVIKGEIDKLKIGKTTFKKPTYCF